MTTTTPDKKLCKCGDELLVHPRNGATVCRHEDFPTPAEMRNGVPMIVLDGHAIADPFAPSVAIKGEFMYAHDRIFNQLKKDTYGSANAA